MITRAAISLALVWLCLPHHPDLGLPDAPCAQPCTRVAESRERDTILERLREVRDELRGSKTARMAANISRPASLSARR